MKIAVTLEAADQVAWFDHSCEIRFRDTPDLIELPDAENPYYEDRDAFILQMTQHENRHAIGPRTIELSDQGVIESFAGQSFLSPWQDLDFWTQTESHIFVVHPSMNAHVIPKRNFLRANEMIEFTNVLNGKLKERA